MAYVTVATTVAVAIQISAWGDYKHREVATVAVQVIHTDSKGNTCMIKSDAVR